ncbi:hypothetical protein GE061_001424 [Apolygus lucorum]|uniref:MD-2-related lipid-recognition domain-containing protein n=1 Tax=Apolygus lucorum TaxID=248454 RepID=A0A6A4K7V2_APOLU|nr:hypothetical protein GE061_001424 [Apolygus lucorum]
MKIWVVLPVIFIWQALRETHSGPAMGPAVVIVKFAESCPFKLPSMVEFSMRLMQTHGKTLLNFTAVMPFKFSDKIGYEINIAIKRNGVWKPNFFKMRGNGMCNIVKSAQLKLFVLMAKSLHATEPYTCPLPAGTVFITDYVIELGSAGPLLGGSLPYGELRANVNVTHKSTDIVSCNVYYIDIVPKRSKANG